jgi:putative FmdB family regulatory protein
MPIYAYKCDACGHAQDILRKISDPALTECPACKAAAFSKQVTAAGFQLKGSGWYVTDFRGGEKKPGADSAPAAEAKTDAAPAGSPAAAPSASATPAASAPSAASATTSVASSAGNTGSST